MAKGARRSLRRFVNKLESGHLLRVYLRPGRRGLAPILEAADLLWAPERLRRHPRGFALAGYFLELCERSSPPAEGRELFSLLRETLRLTEQYPDLPGLKPYFEFRLLRLLGWAPEFELCLACGGRIRESAFFSFRKGGVVCRGCASEEDRRLTPRTLGVLRALNRLSLKALPRMILPQSVIRETGPLLEAFLLKVLDQDIKALKVLRELDHGTGARG